MSFSAEVEAVDVGFRCKCPSRAVPVAGLLPPAVWTQRTYAMAARVQITPSTINRFLRLIYRCI